MYSDRVIGVLEIIGAVVLILLYHNVIPLRADFEKNRMQIRRRLRPLVWFLCPLMLAMGLLDVFGVL